MIYVYQFSTQCKGLQHNPSSPRSRRKGTTCKKLEIFLLACICLLCVSCAAEPDTLPKLNGHELLRDGFMEGQARLEDIIFLVESPSAARRTITDRDGIISVKFENLSGRQYSGSGSQIALELRIGNRWVNADWYIESVAKWEFGVFEWMVYHINIPLNEPLPAGEYRLLLELGRLYAPGEELSDDTIELEYEFSVVRFEDAPPEWDASLLFLSSYDAADQISSLSLAAALNAENSRLELSFTTDRNHSFGEDYELDVLLDGKWYRVPYAEGDFTALAYSTDSYTNQDSVGFSVSPARDHGVLPAGQYRLIMYFSAVAPRSQGFAIAEFEVEDTLDWLLL